MSAPIPYEASWLSQNPQNLNYARPTGFRLDILNIPTTSFFCQTATLPGISIGVAQQPTPMLNLPWPGEKLTFDELQVKFIVQSDFNNFNEMYNWFVGMADPANTDTIQEWINTHSWRFPYPSSKISGQFVSDGTLTVLSANNVPNLQFHFHNMFPTAMSGIEFDISEGRTDYLTAHVSFRYDYFVPIPLGT